MLSPLAFGRVLTTCSVVLALSSASAPTRAQQQTAPQPQGQTTSPQTTPDQTAPDQGGPGGDNGSIAIPKKKEQPAPPPPPPAEPVVKTPPELSNYSLRVDVPQVNVDVGVILEKTHQVVPNLQEANVSRLPLRLCCWPSLLRTVTALSMTCAMQHTPSRSSFALTTTSP